MKRMRSAFIGQKNSEITERIFQKMLDMFLKNNYNKRNSNDEEKYPAEAAK